MIHIRTMTAADLPLGMRLKQQAGWNQTEADWQRVLTLEPDGCFVAECDGRPVGTTATTVFDSIGWLEMVLVDEAFRGQGIGKQLMRHALACLDGRGVPTARLDATPLGRPLYEKLGFVAEYELARMEGIAAGGTAGEHVSVAAEDLDAICALDLQATGTNRRRLLEGLHRERPEAMQLFVADGVSTGYATARIGSRATQIGPIVARSAAAGEALADAALLRYAGQPVFLDIPVQSAAAMHWAESRGLRVQRHLTRMVRGAPVADRPDLLWAGFGPEKG
jgi:GNAT superfamily N-acetyltransferase